MTALPGIFNDIIGPVMRGPSSSHTAASWRISKTCLDILGEPLKNALIEFDKNGAWASNFREQGTEMGINGGLLGMEITDQRIKDTQAVIKERRLSVHYEINAFPTNHPNTVRISLEGKHGKKTQVLAASLGGGSFEIQKVDQFEVSIKGDYFELLIFNKNKKIIDEEIQALISEYPKVFWHQKVQDDLINLKSPEEFPEEIIRKFKNRLAFDHIIQIKPILPIISGNQKELPFSNIESMLEYAKKEQLDLGEIGIIYEKCISGLSASELSSKMEGIIRIIEDSIKTGLKGTDYNDRILLQQSHLIELAEKSEKIPDDFVVNKTVANVTAIMEAKSAMEVIVANPTAGSCGTIGGLVSGVSENLNLSKEEIVNAYFAAGLIGIFFASGPGFSAEEHGCQVECGAASGMAAAALVQLYGGTAKQAVDAASMAIQNMIGLICDPVADRVEIPCLGKNISAAMNALSSATMACAGFDAVIPLEEVIETVSKVSKQMPGCVKCTGKGGLAITPTSKKLKIKLNT